MCLGVADKRVRQKQRFMTVFRPVSIRIRLQFVAAAFVRAAARALASVPNWTTLHVTKRGGEWPGLDGTTEIRGAITTMVRRFQSHWLSHW